MAVITKYSEKSKLECENISEGDLNKIKKLARKCAGREDFITIYITSKNRFKRAGDVEYLEIDDLVF